MGTNEQIQYSSLAQLMFMTRTARRLSMKDFGAIFGISAPQVCRFENGEATIMRPENAQRFCEAFDIPSETYQSLACDKKNTQIGVKKGHVKPKIETLDIVNLLTEYTEQMKSTGVKSLEFTINGVHLMITF